MIASSSASLVGPTRIRVPSYGTTSSSWMLSTVLPPISACTPHELLPIMPPSVQRLCVAGSGANVSWCSSAASRTRSSTMPGCTRATPLPGSSSTMRFMYFEKSMMTATLQHWPARLVPAPRGRIGAPLRGTPRSRRPRPLRRAESRPRSGPADSSTRRSRRARALPSSKRTSPRTVCFSARSSASLAGNTSRACAWELGRD